MKDLLLKNIKQIVKHPSENQSIWIRNGVIEVIGPLQEIRKNLSDDEIRRMETVNCSTLVAIPGFVDAHTHLVFAGSREKELYLRAAGADYLEIHRKGGGIHDTVRAVRAASEEELIRNGLKWLDRALRFGTTTIEIKSGYGLDVETERKMLKVIRKLNEIHPMDVIPTFLVHAVPKDVDRKNYLDSVCSGMIPEFREYAEWFDLFLEDGVFDLAESEMLIRNAEDAGYWIGLHTNQIHDIGGIKLAVDYGIRHVDHLEILEKRDAERILDNPWIYPVFLPGSEYHTFSEHVGQIHSLKSIPTRIVCSTDFNPGTSPVLSPAVVMNLAVLRYRLDDPGLVMDAFTSNAADMLFLKDRGRIEKGRKADIVLIDVDRVDQIPYWGTMNLIRHVIKNGHLIGKET